MLPPFEMALRAGARSVMNAYTDIDGVPSAADASAADHAAARHRSASTGTVVADYFSVAFLHTLHRDRRRPRARPPAWPSRPGIDVELPSDDAYGAPLLAALDAGLVDEKLVDRALRRVLRQKCELGLLDPDWAPAEPSAVDLDAAGGPGPRAASSRAARSCCSPTTGRLPLAPRARGSPWSGRAPTPSEAMLGCYSFPMHVLPHHPGAEPGLAIRTVREALADDVDVVTARLRHRRARSLGGRGRRPRGGAAGGRRRRAGAEVCVAVLGDQAGLFGKGTSGEGCDAADLRLPGRQEELLEALLATGTPVVAVLLVGRPYDLSRQADRLAGRRVRLLPGRGGRAGDRRRAHRPGRTRRAGCRSASRARASPSRRPTSARRWRTRTEVSERRPDAALPLRARPGLRRATWGARRAASAGRRWATDGDARARRGAGQRGRPGGVRGGAGLPARPGGLGRTTGAAAGRRGPRRPRRRASGAGCASRCTPTSRRSPVATWRASSSPARWSSGSVAPARTTRQCSSST